MPSQITHAALTMKSWPKLQASFDQAPFLIGTLFPDIRYLRVVKREQTHLDNVSFAEVLAEPKAFAAGMKFHSFVDQTHNQFFCERGIYDLLPESRHITRAVKFYEDELYFSLIDGWIETAKMLDQVLSEQIAYGISPEVLQRWHRHLQAYFSAVPSTESRAAIILGLGFPAEVADEIEKLIHLMRQRHDVTVIIRDYWNAFPTFTLV